MEYTEYKDAVGFLAVTEEILVENEAVNGLMYGLAFRLEDPLLYGSQPLLATVGESGSPDLLVLMTPPRKLQIMATQRVSEDALALLAKKLREGKWPVPAVIAARETAEAFASEWSARTGRRSRTGTEQRIYELREVNHPEYPRGAFRQATSNDLDLAKEWTAASGLPASELIVEDKVNSGSLFFWEASEPVSMAGRSRPTPNGESVSLVYTPPRFRRNGYATAVVARLSQRILDEGKRFCALYTDLSNPTSNSIYMKIGYRPVADVIDIHFEE